LINGAELEEEKSPVRSTLYWLSNQSRC
jgi:hypothetical protein